MQVLGSNRNLKEQETLYTVIYRLKALPSSCLTVANLLNLRREIYLLVNAVRKFNL